MPLAAEAGFALLYAVTSVPSVDGVPAGRPEARALPTEASSAYLDAVDRITSRLLGEAYRRLHRIVRHPVARVHLDAGGETPLDADVYLAVHSSGVAVWEVWIPVGRQPFNAERWKGWLDFDTAGSVAARLWSILAGTADDPQDEPARPEFYLPFSVVRVPDHELEDVVERHGPEIVQLLQLGPSRQPLKATYVAEVLDGDFCLHQGGISLLGRRGAVDVHAPADLPGALPPLDAVPFLITLEMLVLERAVLRALQHRLTEALSEGIEDLVMLKQQALDALEEYYGTLTVTNAFSAKATRQGQELLGVDDLYDSVVDRMEIVTFAITTNYQRNSNLLTFWLTIVFGAVETGSLAAVVATWYYHEHLLMVLAWTLGMTMLTAFVIIMLLRSKAR
ncbi:MAG TPA: hypothetical protein VNJ51_05605 [Candidatus Dormibacteraeota bacterium]|nr:hypothetical protein [Candidatus Dormibacteraeota bacterium]